MAEPKITGATLKVLGVLSIISPDEMAGVHIGQAANLVSGTLYPALMRLENAGWLESRWEVDDPKLLGRPRRRLYRITDLGKEKARAAVEDLAPIFSPMITNFVPLDAEAIVRLYRGHKVA